ncbi:Phospholipase/carboxylesterase [Trichoderma chlorosporum]
MKAPLLSTQRLTGYTYSVVFLPGSGYGAAAFSNTVQNSLSILRNAFPDFRWVFPTPLKRSSALAGSEAAPQWFDVDNEHDSSEGEDVQVTGLRQNIIRLRDILNQEAHKLGGRWDRVILAGLDQGAGIAAHTLLSLYIAPRQSSDGETQPGRLGAFIGISGQMPFPGKSLVETHRLIGLGNATNYTQVLINTPVLLEHCADDTVVPVEDGYTLRDALTELGAHVNWKEYSTGGHWVNLPSGASDMVEFLKAILAYPLPDEDRVVSSRAFRILERHNMEL